MKTIRVFVICMLASLFVTAQDTPNRLSELTVTPPFFTGERYLHNYTSAELQSPIDQYLAINFKVPDSRRFASEGRQVVQFLVNADGTLSDFEIINSISHAIDEEIIRVLKKTDHMWRPGLNDGMPVAMTKEITVAIRSGYTEDGAMRRDFRKIAQSLFTKGAECLLVKGKTKKAIRHFSQAIRYEPHDNSLFLMRGICHHEVGNTPKAYKDWDRYKKLAGNDAINLPAMAENVKGLDGYKEFLARISDK